MTRSIREIIRNNATLLLFVSVIFSKSLYEASLGIGNRLSLKNSQKIEDISHLERLIEEKKKEAHFNGNIAAKIDSTGEKTKTGWSRKIENGSYEIVLNKNYLNTKTLDHELYHVFDGHVQLNPNFLDYLKYVYYNEPKTIIHTLMEK